MKETFIVQTSKHTTAIVSNKEINEEDQEMLN